MDVSAGRTKGWLWCRLWLASGSCWIWQVLHACQDWLEVAKQLSHFPQLLFSTCYSDTGYYGMDWFDAMQCCYYQVHNSSILAHNVFFCSMVMWPNPWVKRSMTQSPSTLQSVRIFLTRASSNVWFVKENVKTKLRFFLSKWRGQAECLVAWWNRPSPWGSIPSPAGTILNFAT